MRVIGLEPTRLTAPDPKSGAAANYATPARDFPVKRLSLIHISLVTCDNRVTLLYKAQYLVLDGSEVEACAIAPVANPCLLYTSRCV